MTPLWTIQLFGPLTLTGQGHHVTHFRTQKTAVLLGYLASQPPHMLSREAAITLLWPDGTPEAGRNSLSTALSALRQQLEPAGTPAHMVLGADRFSIRLHPPSFTTDIAQFAAVIQAADIATSPMEQYKALRQAAEAYHGPFLSTLYDDWVILERHHLAQRYQQVLEQLVKVSTQVQLLEQVLPCIYQALRYEPRCEEAHLLLVRVLLLTGQPTLAMRHYHETERLWAEQLQYPLSVTWGELVATSITATASHAAAFFRAAPIEAKGPAPSVPVVNDAEQQADYLLDLVIRVRPALQGPDQEHWLGILTSADEELRQALHYWQHQGNARKFLHMAQQLELFWDIHNRYDEGRTWLALALAAHAPLLATEADRLLHAEALNSAGALARSQGDFVAALTAYRASYELWEQMSDDRAYFPLANMGLVAHYQGDHTQAEHYLRTSLALAQGKQHLRVEAAICNNLGATLSAQQRYPEAVAIYQESMTLYQAVGNTRGIAKALSNLAAVSLRQHDGSHARAYLKRSLELHRDLHDELGIAIALENLALLTAREGGGTIVPWLYGVATQVRETIHATTLNAEEMREYAEARASVVPPLTARAWQDSWEIGMATALSDAWIHLDTLW